MRTVRTARPTSVPARRLWWQRLAGPVAAVAALSTLAVDQAPVDPIGPSATSVVSGDTLEPVAANRVVLKRRRGRLTGDGRTLYVANRTTFKVWPNAIISLPPRVRANAWIVADLDTGQMLGRNNHRMRLPQASTLKLLTAITATRTIPARRKHRVTRYEASQICSCAYIRPGEVYTRDALLTAMLLKSANDAAEAVAGMHPQGRWAFYRAMNQTARELGARDTVARNASGLTARGSHSSARDLLLILRAALKDDTVSRILGTPRAVLKTAAGRRARTIWRGTDYVNRYAGSLGKSGWTTPAQNTLVVVTEIDGRRIATAHLGAPSGYSTTGARALTEWASGNYAGIKPVGRLPRS